jgi:hypothetical protein
MDFSNYDGLKAAIADELDRTDLAGQIPGFITLAEAKMRRKVRRKTIRATVTFAAGRDTFQLPGDCAQLRSLRLVTGLRYLDTPIPVGTIEQLSDFRAQTSPSARPQRGAILGGSILLAPTPDQNYTAEITYFEKLNSLSSAVETNSILDEAPDLYFYGALLHSAPFMQHDERIPVWEKLFEDGIMELDVARLNEESGASLRPARLPMVFG